MKNSRLIGILLCCAMLVSLCSCQWADDYGVFYWRGIGDRMTKRPLAEYPDGADFEAFIVSGVTVLPVIRPTGGSDFGVGFHLYSRESIAEVTILRMELIREREKLLAQDYQFVIPLEWAEEGYYFGGAYVCRIPEVVLRATRGAVFQFTADVRITSTDGTVTERTLSYTADVYQNRSLVLPT